MSVFGEWYALLKDTAIRKDVEISMITSSGRDAMKREVTELSDNFCGELSVHRSGRRDGRSFFYGLKIRNTRKSVKRKIPRTEIAKTYENQGGKRMSSQKIRLKLKAYDHKALDQSAAKIVETAKKTGADVSGPIPLPTEKEVVTILRAVHKYKDSREQFEQRTHKRLIDILNPAPKTVDALMKLDMPAGVDIEIKL